MDGPDVARSLNLDQVAVVDESGTIYLTPKMEQRITFAKVDTPVIIEE